MKRQTWKPGNMLYPVPAVMVSCSNNKIDNILTVAWVGTICSNPPMISISVRKERLSHSIIKDTEEFVVNLTTKDLTFATDYCGVVSGRDVDKWEKCNLTKIQGTKVNVPMIKESPVNIECKVTQIIELGSHDLFIAEVVAVNVDEQYMTESGKFDLMKAKPIVYNHGEYFGLDDNPLGKFGYSICKKK